jgi:hypothetical protein
MNIAQMTKVEFKELRESVIEQKLLELLDDPDAELPIQPYLRSRLLNQQRAIANGERGKIL